MSVAEAVTTLRVLLVDDHPLVREGIAARLGSEPGIEVVGEAGDAASALACVPRLRPAIVLTDIGMKGVNGIELTRRLLVLDPSLRVLVLSMYDSADYAQQALAAGALGYVLKDAPSAEIVAALRSVAAGGTFLSPALAQRLFRQAPAPRTQLSEREQQILALLAQGLSSKQIARTLDIGVRTVETHRQAIRRKLDLAGQAELIRYAVEHARGGLPQP